MRGRAVPPHPRIYRVPPPPSGVEATLQHMVEGHIPAFLPGGGRGEIESLLSPLTSSLFLFCWRSPLFAHVQNAWNRLKEQAHYRGLLRPYLLWLFCQKSRQVWVKKKKKTERSRLRYIFCPCAVFRQSGFVVLSLELSPLLRLHVTQLLLKVQSLTVLPVQMS